MTEAILGYGPAWVVDGAGRRVADDGTLSGDPLLISPHYGLREQTAVTYQPQTGQFLLAWQQAAAAPAPDIFIQRVDSQGQTMGDPLNLTGHSAAQEQPAVAAGQSGYLAVWRDNRNESSTNWDLYGHLLDTTGTVSGSLVTISTAADIQSNPAAAYNDRRDEYLVVWEEYRNGTEADIYGQVVRPDGSLGPSFGLTVAGPQRAPDVAYNPDLERYLVVWEDDRPGTPGYDIYGQVISADGSLLGTDFVVASGSNKEYNPVVAYGGQSRTYLVAWWDKRNGNWDIYGQRLESSGVLTGSNLAISTAGPEGIDQEYPALAVRPSGQSDEFLVSWQDRRTGWARDIYGQRVGADGSLLDEPDTGADETDPTVNVVLAESSDYLERPVVGYSPHSATGSAQGIYLVAWNNRNDGDIYSLRYSSGTTMALTHTHLYTRAGIYTVSLTANGTGGSDSQTRPGYLTLWPDTPHRL